MDNCPYGDCEQFYNNECRAYCVPHDEKERLARTPKNKGTPCGITYHTYNKEVIICNTK